MLFKSPFSLFRKVVRHEIKIPHPTMPVILETIPALRAEFGQAGSEFDYTAPDGSAAKGVEIRGHYFDSEIAQEQNGWTDEERELVEKDLVELSQRWPRAVSVVEQQKAAAPWPTYDATPYGKIVELAVTLGLVAEAATYEKQNKARPTVLAALEEKLAAAPAAETPEDGELAVA